MITHRQFLIYILTVSFIWHQSIDSLMVFQLFTVNKTFSSLREWAFVTFFCPSSVSACVSASVRYCFIQTTSSLKPLIGFWPNFTGLIPGWPLTKVVQTVPVSCLDRSRGQKIDFQNAIFRNLVYIHKAQSFHIWYIASSRGPLPKLFKWFWLVA